MTTVPVLSLTTTLALSFVASTIMFSSIERNAILSLLNFAGIATLMLEPSMALAAVTFLLIAFATLVAIV